MIEREYDPTLLGFVVDVNPKYLQIVKDQLVEVVSQMESDEKAYIYHPTSNEIPRWVGQAVGSIANYKPAKIDLRKAFKKILALMFQEDNDARRYLFVVTDGCFWDRPEPYLEKLAKIIEQKNIPVWDRQDIVVVVYQTEGINGGNPWFHCLTIELDNLALRIRNMYKEKDGRTETSTKSEADAT